jgi:DNA (cytosine-5)-methyltransferase 1
MNELALFSGAGGGILGGILCGFRTVCAVEIDPFRAAILVARQNDSILPFFPVWDNVLTFDGVPWRGLVDVVSGGFPCQDISAAGRGAGINGERSGLWREFARIVRQVQPAHVLVENSPRLTGKGIDRVLGDLAGMGYDAEWGVLGADDCGAPHIRKRIWIVAHSTETRCSSREREAGGSLRDETRRQELERSGFKISDSDEAGLSQRAMQRGIRGKEDSPSSRQVVGCYNQGGFNGAWPSEPDVGRVVNGMAGRVDAIKALGDGQVPAVVRLAWETLRP